ncbi:hypothetical protein [Ectopseudomonas toyotomiensis]
MVNSAYHVYLYRPALRRFEQLQIPPALMERVNCAWLSELQPDSEERALYSHCRSGPRWYYDAPIASLNPVPPGCTRRCKYVTTTIRKHLYFSRCSRRHSILRATSSPAVRSTTMTSRRPGRYPPHAFTSTPARPKPAAARPT